jgi:hypothetical protein
LSKTDIRNKEEFYMSKMAELLKSFPAIDDGAYESRLKGVLFLKEHSISPENRWYMTLVFASLFKVTRSAIWVARSFDMMPKITW